MQWNDIDAVQLLINLGPIGDILRCLTAFVGQEENKSDMKLVKTYQKRFQEYLPQLQNYICQYLDEIYARITTNVEEQIQKIYEQEIETSLAAIKQAQNIKVSLPNNLDVKHEALALIMILVPDSKYLEKS
ncbi:MAG: hypothetical protein HC907_37635 [Richelia sp. SM1_7_0]|nr:hypothetical protein [Richelia sp. SM1_7_0]